MLPCCYDNPEQTKGLKMEMTKVEDQHCPFPGLNIWPYHLQRHCLIQSSSFWDRKATVVLRAWRGWGEWGSVHLIAFYHERPLILTHWPFKGQDLRLTCDVHTCDLLPPINSSPVSPACSRSKKLRRHSRITNKKLQQALQLPKEKGGMELPALTQYHVAQLRYLTGWCILDYTLKWKEIGKQFGEW